MFCILQVKAVLQGSRIIIIDRELDGKYGGQDTGKKLRKTINHLKSDGKTD
jgi:hypothetical protein